MADNKIWSSITIFETGLSAAEWGWRIITLVFIGGSATGSALIAKADPILSKLGPIYWIATGIVVALALSLIFFLIKSAFLKQSIADLYKVQLMKKSDVNPLAESFTNLIIHIEDLKLPGQQLHKNKHFKGCIFTGPSTLAIIGGLYRDNNFNACGEMIALPSDIFLSGVTVLLDCTVEKCQFLKLTILVDQATGKEMLAHGAPVRGIESSNSEPI